MDIHIYVYVYIYMDIYMQGRREGGEGQMDSLPRAADVNGAPDAEVK